MTDRSVDPGRPDATDWTPGGGIDLCFHRLFHTSSSSSPRLRVGLRLDGLEAPRYVRPILADLRQADFVDLCFVRMPDRLPDRPTRTCLLRRLFEATLDRQYAESPDPFEPVDVSDLLAGIDGTEESITSTHTAEAKDRLDVLLDLRTTVVTGSDEPSARYGTWSLHHGDGSRYTGTPPYFWELVDGNPVTGTELRAFEPSSRQWLVLRRGFVSTDPALSHTANRFVPGWASTHFVIERLWRLHQTGWDGLLAEASPTPSPTGKDRWAPGNLDMVRWLVPQIGRRLKRKITRKPRQTHWKIAVRQSQTPLYRDTSPEALASFRWLDSPSHHFWADPFLFEHDGRTWLFFEDYDHSRAKGHLAAGWLDAAGRLQDVRPILDEPYHLSYPHIFAHEGEIFMIPESSAAGRIALFRCESFPDRWTLESTLLHLRAVDTTVFTHRGRWWMFTSPMTAPGHAPAILLLEAPGLRGPWRLHPSGAVCSDVRLARSAGGIIQDGPCILRPSQDCGAAYGRAIVFNRVDRLDSHGFLERPFETIEPSWQPDQIGVHSYSRSGDWEAVDGNFRVETDSAD